MLRQKFRKLDSRSVPPGEGRNRVRGKLSNFSYLLGITIALFILVFLLPTFVILCQEAIIGAQIWLCCPPITNNSSLAIPVSKPRQLPLNKASLYVVTKVRGPCDGPLCLCCYLHPFVLCLHLCFFLLEYVFCCYLSFPISVSRLII